MKLTLSNHIPSMYKLYVLRKKFKQFNRFINACLTLHTKGSVSHAGCGNRTAIFGTE